MSDFLYRFLSGWMEIRVKGRHVERLISEIAQAGYRLWSVRRIGDTCIFFATLSAIPLIRQEALDQDLTVTFLRRGGLPIEWKKSQRRPFLWVGVLTALALVFYATSRIWVIDAVTPNLSSTARAEVVFTAERSGLQLGSVRKQLDIPAIRARMIRALPQYSWIGITVHGVLATIQVVPLVQRPSYHTFSAIVAAESGQVTKLLVYMGAPEVSVGEFVQKGQILISGAVSAPSRVQPGGLKEPQLETVITPAEGDVFANVLHRVNVFQPLWQDTVVTTSQVFVRSFLLIGGRGPFQYQGFGKIPFRHYAQYRSITQLVYRGVNLPIKVLKIVYNETIISRRRLSRTEALALAVHRANRELSRNEAGRGPVVKISRVARWTPKGVWVRVGWVVNQNIAQPRSRR